MAGRLIGRYPGHKGILPVRSGGEARMIGGNVRALFNNNNHHPRPLSLLPSTNNTVCFKNDKPDWTATLSLLGVWFYSCELGDGC